VSSRAEKGHLREETASRDFPRDKVGEGLFTLGPSNRSPSLKAACSVNEQAALLNRSPNPSMGSHVELNTFHPPLHLTYVSLCFI